MSRAGKLHTGVAAMVTLAIALAIALAIGPAGGAFAHDQLLASSPASGERLVAAPDEVTLTFADPVLALGAIIVVTDASGTDWVDGDVTLDGATASVRLRPGMGDAGYEIRWRVVSGDGHPISGIIPFTVGDAEPYSSVAAEGADGVPPAGAPDAPLNSQNDSRSAGPELGALPRTVLLGASGAAVAVAGYVVFLIFRRRRVAEPGGSTDVTRPQA